MQSKVFAQAEPCILCLLSNVIRKPMALLFPFLLNAHALNRSCALLWQGLLLLPNMLLVVNNARRHVCHVRSILLRLNDAEVLSHGFKSSSFWRRNSQPCDHLSVILEERRTA